jgi:hypothetical protein
MGSAPRWRPAPPLGWVSTLGMTAGPAGNASPLAWPCHRPVISPPARAGPALLPDPLLRGGDRDRPAPHTDPARYHEQAPAATSAEVRRAASAATARALAAVALHGSGQSLVRLFASRRDGLFADVPSDRFAADYRLDHRRHGQARDQ